MLASGAPHAPARSNPWGSVVSEKSELSNSVQSTDATFPGPRSGTDATREQMQRDYLVHEVAEKSIPQRSKNGDFVKGECGP